MSQIKPSHLIIILIVTFSLVGCGDKNDKAVFSSDNGHPSGWVKTHKASAKTNIESCKTCHGDNYSGGVSAASCMSTASLSGFTCHVTSPAANTDNCLSCHGGYPSGPFGTVAPNRKSAHTKHTALTECATCHPDAGYGTPNHAKAKDGGYSRASVTDAYNKDNGTCTNVSCHGGITTPGWANGTIGLVAGDNSVCLKCHVFGDAAGKPQFNSYYSGINLDFGIASTHKFHLDKTINGLNINCTDCHNIGTLNDYQKHFNGIATKTFTAPGMTVGGGSTRVESYSIDTKRCSNVECHRPPITPLPNGTNFGGQWIKTQ